MRVGRTARGAVWIGALALTLGACTGAPAEPPTSPTTTPESVPPEESATPDGTDLAPTDVIRIVLPSTSPGGSYGEMTFEITEDTITSSFALRDDTVIYSVPKELTESEREYVGSPAESYMEARPEDRGPQCPHGAPGTVIISGSISHQSEAYSCVTDSPMAALLGAARDVQHGDVAQLAHPYDSWTVEIRPWKQDGPDESSPAERYTLRESGRQDEMTIQAENTPSGWGKHLVRGPGTRRPALAPTGPAPYSPRSTRCSWERTGPIARARPRRSASSATATPTWCGPPTSAPARSPRRWSTRCTGSEAGQRARG